MSYPSYTTASYFYLLLVFYYYVLKPGSNDWFAADIEKHIFV